MMPVNHMLAVSLDKSFHLANNVYKYNMSERESRQYRKADDTPPAIPLSSPKKQYPKTSNYPALRSRSSLSKQLAESNVSSK